MESPRSAAIAERGVKTTRDVTEVAIAMGADVLTGRLNNQTARTACAAYGRALESARLGQRFGLPVNQSGGKVMDILPDASTQVEAKTAKVLAKA